VSISHTQRVRRLFEEHAGNLRVFFRKRVRNPPDAVDLAQEVYLRVLAAGDPRAIRNVEAYLFTVASNLVREHALIERRRWLRHTEMTDPQVEAQMVEQPAYDDENDRLALNKYLGQVLPQLPPRSQAVLRMVYVDGLSHPQIGDKLRLSKSMVRKIHVEAIQECRRRMRRLGAV
jgi:RNA polymerase sigma-70 factor (ECF subfamily)